MPSRYMGDLSSNDTDRPSATKDTSGFFPDIKRNGLVGSHNGTDCNSSNGLNYHQGNHKSRSVSRSVSIATNKDSSFSLPAVDRSKTNSICSYASSNISSVSSRNTIGKIPHLNSDHLRLSCDLNSNCQETGKRLDYMKPHLNGDYQHNDSMHGNLKGQKPNSRQSADRRSGTGDVIFPDIFACKSSSIGSPVQSPSPTFRHQNRLSKKQSASFQDLTGQLRREESTLLDNYKHFNRSPNSCVTTDSHGYQRTDNVNTVRSSLPTPVLFPMRESETRLSRKNSVKRKDKQNRRENENALKENGFKEAIEKLEVFSGLENVNEDKSSLVLGKPNSLQKVREETEVDQYIYANGYEHHSKGHKGRKRAQSEDRRSAKVH